MNKNSLYIVIMLLLGSPCLFAQELLKGKILELGSNEEMSQVSVRNANTDVLIESNAQGDFSIAAKKDEILIFSFPGYRTDSLVVTDFAFKRIYLTGTTDPLLLSEVNVTAMTNSRLEEEKAKAQEGGRVASTVSGGGIGISPSRIFGSEGRNARRSYKMMEEEANNRDIDARFNAALIQSLTPLEGEDLELFMIKYRPKVSFMKRAKEEDLRIYIIDSYGKYNKLTDSQKEKIKLDKENS